MASTPALVVDIDTGKVLYAERATDPWQPASVTKLMTTYVALDLARQGKVSLDQLITVSAEAASQPPSKMGFRPGQQLTLDNALKIIMVKSANDVAATIAENLGGSVEGFADMMNAAARRIGMRESRWFNPHGLPDDRQQTSARDMAVLGRALLREFPDHSDLFSIGAVQFGRRVMRNHNGLLGRYPGVDGMKTGFICASGFNVVASANRNGRRLITVVFGASKPKEREIKAFDLFDRGFATAPASFFSSGGQTLETLPDSNLVAAPNLRPVICGRGGPVPAEEEAATDPIAAAMAGGNAGNAENAGAPAFSSQALAFAGAAAPGAAWQTRELPPRAPVQPVLVWLGRDPAGAAVVASEGYDEAKPEPKPRTPKVAAKPAPQAAEPKPAATPKVAAKPEPAEAEPKPAAAPKVAAKPAPRREAKKPEPKVAAKPEASDADEPEAKPASAPKPAKPAPARKPVSAAAAKAKPAGTPAQAYTSTDTSIIADDGKVRKPAVNPAAVLDAKPKAVEAKPAEPKKPAAAKPAVKAAEKKPKTDG